MEMEDEDGNKNAFQNIDAYANLLSIIMTSKKDDEIQGELIELVGFNNFEFLGQILDKREYIKDLCKSLTEKIQLDKQTNQNYKPKNMSTHTSLGVAVEVKDKKGKKGKGGKQGALGSTAAFDNEKITNYDLLKRLGFDKDSLEEQRRRQKRDS